MGKRLRWHRFWCNGRCISRGWVICDDHRRSAAVAVAAAAVADSITGRRRVTAVVVDPRRCEVEVAEEVVGIAVRVADRAVQCAAVVVAATVRTVRVRERRRDGVSDTDKLIFV